MIIYPSLIQYLLCQFYCFSHLCSFSDEIFLEEDRQLPPYPRDEATTTQPVEQHHHYYRQQQQHETVVDLHRAKLDVVVTEVDEELSCPPTPSSPELPRFVSEDNFAERENGILAGNNIRYQLLCKLTRSMVDEM